MMPRTLASAWCSAVLWCMPWCVSAPAADHKSAKAEKKDERPIKIDPALPDYKPVGKLSGRLRPVGSDTMNSVMTLWAEEFLKLHPDVQLQLGRGSTAPPALIAGTTDIGMMVRQFRPRELEEFEKKYGYKPTYLVTSFDMLGVMVHKDNPIESLTMEQLDAIFSKTRKRGHKEVRTWGDLGLKGEWTDKPISMYGRSAAASSYGFFKERVLSNGDFNAEVKEQPGNSTVVQSLAIDKSGIGYAGIGYAIPEVRVVPLVPATGKKSLPGRSEFAYSSEYPLARPLYIVLNHKPGTELDPLRREFIKFVFAKQGQTEVVKCGFVPVTAKIAREQLEKVGLAKEE